MEGEEIELPKNLRGDQIRLKQVLINLTKNALKFTPNGRVTIKTAFDYEEELLHVHINDSGKGISESDQQKLFQAFGKLQDDENENMEGVGMGLAISKRIV